MGNSESSSGGGGGGGGGGGDYAHDIKTKSGLTSAYNERVVSAQRVTRDLSSSGDKSALGFKHEGVRVTTESGKQWLVHSGPNYGKSSDAVLVDAKHMDKKTWSDVGQAKNIGGSHSVGAYVGAASKNPNYSVMSNNCWDSTDRMMALGNKKK